MGVCACVEMRALMLGVPFAQILCILYAQYDDFTASLQCKHHSRFPQASKKCSCISPWRTVVWLPVYILGGADSKIVSVSSRENELVHLSRFACNDAFLQYLRYLCNV